MQFHAHHPLNSDVKKQLLITSCIAASGAVLFKLFHPPFFSLFYYATLASCVVHLAAFCFFKYLEPCFYIWLSFFNMVTLSLIIHATGGLLSPYTVILAAILLSNITFGINTVLDVPVLIFIYSTVIAMEYFGYIQRPVLSAADVYKNNATTLIFFGSSILVFIFLARYFENIIITFLKKQISAEHEKNATLKDKILKMNSIYEMGFMVSQLVHEFSNPMTTISGFISLLTSSADINQETKEDLNKISLELNHLTNQIIKLRAFIKPGDGEKNYFLLNSTVDIAVSILKMDHNFKKIEFKKSYDLDTKYIVYGCKDEIQQVIYNFLKNSAESILEANNNNGIIEIIFHKYTENLKICIKDNGKGIEPDKLQNIFDNYFTTKTNGLGLGLGIAKSILDSHKSNLSIASEVGKGTVLEFTISLTPYDLPA